MIPSQIREYLKLRGQVSLTDLSSHFDADPDAVRAMMDIWIRKGKVEESETASCSKGCCSCNPEPLTIYAWKDK